MADKEEILKVLSELPGVGEKRAEMLYGSGINSVEDIVEMGLSGLAGIPQIGFSTAKKILSDARDAVEDKIEVEGETEYIPDDELDSELGLEDDIESLLDEEEIDDISTESESEEDDFDLEELEHLLGEDETDEDIEEELDEDVEDELDEDIEDELDMDIEELEKSLGGFEEETEDTEAMEVSEETVYVEKDIESDLENILHTIEDEDEVMPDMETAREIDKWLEEKAGIGEHIGEESVCPVCGDVVSIYEERCDTCGVEFAPSDVKCGYCDAIFDAEQMKCPDCGMALVDEKTVCPICNSIVYASEMICPFCGVEFHEDRVRCSECKGTVPIDAVVCPHCETILREKIIEEVISTRGGPMKVSSESTQVDVGSIQLQVTPGLRGGGKSTGLGSSRNKAKAQRILFPFPAIVNQKRMKRALILNAVNPDIGGLLIEGQRGTAKSIAVRGLAEVLPPIEVVSDCRFSCDPHEPDKWCWECREKYGEGGEIPVKTRPVNVVDLPLNATEDRVVGTLDVEKILSEGIKSFDEGILADVNRGILYVDEINLLDDYIVDVLLDAAAMGVVTVEREEISLSYPSKFIIVGSMNPEEGALRPQLLDRLALNIKVTGIPDAKERIKIIHRNEEFLKDPHAFRDSYKDKIEDLGGRIVEARERVNDVMISSEMDNVIAKLAVDFEVDGHRADIIIKRTSMTNAAYEGRTEVTTEDIMLAAEMALPHRMRKGPLEEAEFSVERLKRLIRGYTV